MAVKWMSRRWERVECGIPFSAAVGRRFAWHHLGLSPRGDSWRGCEGFERVVYEILCM